MWELPGGPLLPEHDDVDAGMDAILTAMGLAVPAIEDDFASTVFLPAADGHTVYNLYVPSEWTGEPSLPAGVGAGWFALDEIDAVAMDEAVRNTILEAFGLRDAPDNAGDMLAALNAAMGPEGAPERPASGAGDGLDVLHTLTGRDPEAVREGMRRHYPELADDVVSALGDFWTDPVLDRRTRSLQTVAMLAAMGGKQGPLRSHINGALNHGATPAQLVETLRMVAVYAGFPASLEAWPIMEEVFVERGIPRPGRTP
jgi:4-carboxymuconolactone decarboxylase